MFLLLLVIFAGTTAGLWFQGLWSGLVTLVNMILAMVIATSFYEPASSAIEGFGAQSWTYLLDFVVLWLLFFLAYSILRGVSDSLSTERVKFDPPIEMGAVRSWPRFAADHGLLRRLQPAHGPLNAASPRARGPPPTRRRLARSHPIACGSASCIAARRRPGRQRL
jgi:hypothetical protein